MKNRSFPLPEPDDKIAMATTLGIEVQHFGTEKDIKVSHLCGAKSSVQNAQKTKTLAQKHLRWCIELHANWM